MFVYLLVDSRAQLSYRGFTVNMQRRLRQHRREIVGGARYTARFDECSLLCYISGFDSKREALSFEWYTKRNRTAKVRPRVLACSGARERYISRFCHTLMHPKFVASRERLTLHCSPIDGPFLAGLAEHYGVSVRKIGGHPETKRDDACAAPSVGE